MDHETTTVIMITSTWRHGGEDGDDDGAVENDASDAPCDGGGPDDDADGWSRDDDNDGNGSDGGQIHGDDARRAANCMMIMMGGDEDRR